MPELAIPDLHTDAIVLRSSCVRGARVAEKAGFQREGLLRRYLVVKGERRDCVLFSLLRDDL